MADNIGPDLKTLSLRNCGLDDFEFSRIADALVTSRAKPLVSSLNDNKHFLSLLVYCSPFVERMYVNYLKGKATPFGGTESYCAFY